MDLSIIILSYNTQKLLRGCLASVFKYTKNINFEVIVIDNASSDDSVKMVKKEFPQAKLIKNKDNLGFAKANNQGIKEARGQYILLLNSDTELKDNALIKLISFAKTKKNLAVVGSRLLMKDGQFQPSVGRFFTLPMVALWLLTGDRFLLRSPKEPGLVDWVQGSCFLINQKIIKKIGFLDERFFMYIEEMEFCYRLKKAGLQTWFYPQAEVYHLVRGSSSKDKKQVIWWIYEGLIYFYKKHFGPWQQAVLKFLLRLKAGLAWLVGFLFGNRYLKETYAQAFKLAR